MTSKEFKRFMELFRNIFNVPFERIYLGKEPLYMIPRQWGDFRIELSKGQMSVRSIPYPTLFMSLPITSIELTRKGPDEYGGYWGELSLCSGETKVVQISKKYIEKANDIVEFGWICNEYNKEWGE